MLIRWIKTYAHWLHTQWPAGTVEKLPQVNEDGSTKVPGLYVVGDLTGVPLLKFAADTGARAVQTICQEPGFRPAPANKTETKTDPPTPLAQGKGGDGIASNTDVLDLVIIGGGVSGMAAALEARKNHLTFEIIEGAEPFATIADFPRGKPIYTYPRAMQPAGDLQVSAPVKETLLEELREQTLARGIAPRIARAERVRSRGPHLEVVLADGPSLLARRVIVAIGRVTLSYRKPAFNRAKPENMAKLRRLQDTPAASGRVEVLLGSRARRIEPRDVVLEAADGQELRRPNDAVFAMIGREAPLAFFRRSGVPIKGEMKLRQWVAFGLFFAFCVFLYHWKKNAAELPIYHAFAARGWFPFHMQSWLESWSVSARTPGHLLHVLAQGLQKPSFYYTLAYCTCVVVFGAQRMRRRPTPYVRAQTLTLMAIQCLPLFLLPEIILPWMGQNGCFQSGALGPELWLDRTFALALHDLPFLNYE